MEKIKMTQEGYDSEVLYYNNLKKEFDANEIAMTVACGNSSGDGPHDNGEFEEGLRKEKMLVDRMNRQAEKIRNIEIITVEKIADDLVNIGDTISITTTFNGEDPEDDIVTLVGAEGDHINGTVSINSPMGKSIYKAKVGDTVTYEVNSNEIGVKIINKVKENGIQKVLK